MTLDVLKTFAALTFVLGLIFVIAWAFRKYFPGGAPLGQDREGWRVLGGRALGPGRQIMVLEIGSKLLVVGMTKDSMTSLMEVADEADRKIISEALSGKSGTSFADILKRTRGQ